MEKFWRDLRFAWRSAAQNPSHSLLIVAVLAIGIGANTAIFGLANAAFFRALPYPHAERLAFLWQNNQRTGESEGAVSYPNYADWRVQSRSFQDMALVKWASEILQGSRTYQPVVADAGGVEHVPFATVSTNFFSVLGVNPILGRPSPQTTPCRATRVLWSLAAPYGSHASPRVQTSSATASALETIQVTPSSASCLRISPFLWVQRYGNLGELSRRMTNSIFVFIPTWASSAA
ncbi:MAG: hypothetical protein WBE86_02665 [Candidatus Acidiferrales bacterium]